MYACDKSYNQKSVDRNACNTHAYVVENYLSITVKYQSCSF